MTDRRTIFAVVVVLGAVVLACVAIAGLLAVQEKPIPPELVGFGGTALGAVAGLLAKTSSEPPPP